MVQSAQLFMETFLAQAGSGNRRSGKLVLAQACEIACDASDANPGPWGAWGGGIGGTGTLAGNANSGALTYSMAGFAAGLDRELADGFRAGFTVGYTGGSQWVGGFNGQGQSNTVLAGLYGTYVQGPAYLDGLAGYAYSANQLWRSIVILGLTARTAQGATGANQVYGQLEGGWRFDLGGEADAFVTPFARLQAYSAMQNAFSEGGAQSLNLNVAAQTTNSLRSVLGAQLGGAMDLGWRDKLNAQIRLGWSHEYASTDRPVTASFAGAPTIPFTTFGASPQRDGVVIGLSAQTAVADTASLYLRYEGDISGQDSTHALTAGVRLTW
jgi:outer membrane autotransporter protein